MPAATDLTGFTLIADPDRDNTDGLITPNTLGTAYRTLDTTSGDQTLNLKSGDYYFDNIDVQGGRAIKEALPQALLIFLMPPDVETLEARLRGRGTDSEERLQVRLTNAAVEMTQSAFYDHRVVNDDLERAVSEVESIIAQRRA